MQLSDLVKVTFRRRFLGWFMKWIWKIWSFLYFFILLYVVFFSGRRPSPAWGHPHQQPLLVPFKLKWYLYTHVKDVSSVYLDIIGNIIMFTPLPLFLYIVFGVRRYIWMLAVGFFLSLSIEVVQYLTGVGVPDIDDLIFNSFGTVLGVLIIDGIRGVSLIRK